MSRVACQRNVFIQYLYLFFICHQLTRLRQSTNIRECRDRDSEVDKLSFSKQSPLTRSMSLCNFFLPRLKMEAGGGLMTVLGAIISGHKNKCWYEWKSFATILSLCPRHRLGSERRAAVNCKIIYFKKSRQSDWYLILTNDLSFKFFKE